MPQHKSCTGNTKRTTNTMSDFQGKIDIFYKNYGEIFRKALEKIINNMLNKCEYVNGDSLERHDFGGNPKKLKDIPKNININPELFEDELLTALNLKENEKSIIELLWGDIQLGKKTQACIIMWISVHILRRPVLYIFRNLLIDQQQLQDDIVGTENYNFNIQFIKNVFEEFNTEFQGGLDKSDNDYWKHYKLPELKDINSNNVIDKLSNKNAINPTDIFCCLMNESQLKKINLKFNDYIRYNEELVNMTILVDESDLMCPTASNNDNSAKDKKDSTACERQLARIYNKSKYVLHITGTAHSLLYNVTTRLNSASKTQIKISKVHKMKRTNDYYGLFNDSITFDTTLVKSWWKYKDENNHKKKSYDIVEDYHTNIKQIIEIIKQRINVKYNSLLISEDKIRKNQFRLANEIIEDSSYLFVIVFHGNCLRLYLSKEYEEEIKQWSKWDSEQSSTGQRLWQVGGIYVSSFNSENFKILPNNYCYFDINTKILNIKFVYKLLGILFKKSKIPIINKTIVTITGRYGERGYSFTSDDYDNYSLHLTDQYFVSHASLNCTDISQRLRLQGKYNDLELKNGSMKLTLWTTIELYDIITNFYVKFVKGIEEPIMNCKNWEDIRDLLESQIDNGELKYSKYMKHIDAPKKTKNINPENKYDIKKKAYKLSCVNDIEIDEWCKDKKFPVCICINEIKNDLTISEFIDKYGKLESKIEFIKMESDISFEYINKVIKLFNERETKNAGEITQKWIDNRNTHKNGNIWYDSFRSSSSNNDWKKCTINYCRENKGSALDKSSKTSRRNYLCYDDNDDLYLCITYWGDSNELPKNNNNYKINGDKIKYSLLKPEYTKQVNKIYKDKNIHGYANDNFAEDSNKLPDKYFWKTPDDGLYYYDKSRPKISSLKITAPSSIETYSSKIEESTIEAYQFSRNMNLPNSSEVIPNDINLDNQTLQNNIIDDNDNIRLFTISCFIKTNKKNLRFGIQTIHEKYKEWIGVGKIYLTKKELREELSKLDYNEETSKGVDIKNKKGKRGYNIMLEI